MKQTKDDEINKQYVEISKYFVGCILNDNFTPSGLSDLYAIYNGDNKILLEHLKAITNIMNKAIKVLESEKIKNEKDKNI